jgi:predicted RNA-binding Zn-ribbon protein involved in translation (DUF1610 family)
MYYYIKLKFMEEKIALLEIIYKVVLIVVICVYVAWGILKILNIRDKKELEKQLEIQKYEEEKRSYNGCKCTECGEVLKLTINKDHRRIYVCPKCLNTVIITYSSIDNIGE